MTREEKLQGATGAGLQLTGLGPFGDSIGTHVDGARNAHGWKNAFSCPKVLKTFDNWPKEVGQSSLLKRWCDLRAMDYINSFLMEVWMGFRDSISFGRAAFFITKHKAIQERISQCILLNGGIYLGSILLMQFVFRPLILQVVQIFGGEPGSFDVILTGFYHLFWVWPVFFLSLLFNALWYSDIANAAFILQHPDRGPRTLRVKLSIVDAVRSLLLSNIANIVIVALLYTPPLGWVGKVGAFLLSAWIYAFNVADLAWSGLGLRLAQRLTRVEQNWPYYLGFGAVLSFISLRFPFFIYIGLIAVLLPILVLLACASNPPPRSYLPPLPLFHPLKLAAAVLEKALVRFYLGNKAGDDSGASTPSPRGR